MRLFVLVFLSCLLLSCNKHAQKAKKPSFLIGSWKRTNDTPGNETFESWNANFQGTGYTFKNGAKTFSEVLEILSKNDSLYLKVSGVNEKPTLFKFISQTDSSFVCENKKNDFPKRITYMKDGKQLKAIIANDEFRMDFIFDRIN